MSNPPQKDEKALPEDPTANNVSEETVPTKRTAVPISVAKKRSDMAEASAAVAESGPKIDIDKPSKADGKHFEIVLVDMVASVRSQRLICVKKDIYDADPEFSYACVSYRWGEVDEQIALTPDYNAHITSFGLDDLLIVCNQILNWSSDGGFEDEEEDEEGDQFDEEEGDQVDEEDGDQVDEEDGDQEGDQDNEEITVEDSGENNEDNEEATVEDAEDDDQEEEEEYDWHDGDSNGQHNYSETTIRYLWVDAISVDQMDVAHKKATIHRMTEIYSQAKVIVAVPDLHRRYLFDNPVNAECLTMVSKYGRRFLRHINMDCWYHESDDELDNQEEQEEQEEDQTDAKTLNENDEAVPKHRGFRQFLKETIYHRSDKAEDEKSISDLSVGNKSQASLVANCDLATNNTPVKEQDMTEDEEEDDGEEDDEEEERMCLCTEDMDEMETAAYFRAVDFFEYLVKDWSSRVWVISEYSIGRHSNMRLWFISICYDNYELRPRTLCHMFSEKSPILYNNLLDERPLLDIFLMSKASRNEDRFVAVLPLFKEFKQYVDTHALSSWNITDTVSVRLQLLRILEFKEKLALLLTCTSPSFLSDIILPSFATSYQKEICIGRSS